MSTPENILDVNVTPEDVRCLTSADAVTAFFARLNYDTNARITQTPSNLGIATDGLAKQIKKAELIADHGGMFQVYLFELSSVTVAATQGLARAFKIKAGNYLLVLTSDYDRIDFVLLERTLPTADKPGKVAQKQASILPRPLTIDRKDPERRHLRVLRRLTYTESDPYYQYEKLRSAYDVAYWSTDFFDNRALFSDYYLENRLHDEPEWQEDPAPAYRELTKLYTKVRDQWAGKPEAEIRQGLLLPTLEVLGLKAKLGKSAKSSAEEPDYHLRTPDGTTHLADCLVYPWGRSLDSPDDQRDKETSEENPGALVVSLLERGDAQWAIVTNGKHWRLYAARAHNKATNYYEVDLEEVLSREDINESFRYFWLLFRRQAFELTAEIAEHAETEEEPKKRCFLDRLFEGSQEYAKKLGDRLKGRVFDDIFPHLAEGFVKYIGQSEDIARADIPQERLDDVFHGTLTFLYRLLFLLYAESRDLLPVKEARGYGEKSLSRLKNEFADAAGTLSVKTGDKLKKTYVADSYELYDRLTELFTIIDKGDTSRNVPCYNGGLFMTDPPDEDTTSEADNARFLRDHKIPDRFLALGLDLMARDEDEKTDKVVFIDYKSLGVRQLGSIYEGLLEFKLRIAREKMALVKGKKIEEVVPYAEAVSNERKVLTDGRGKNASERTYAKGKVYLENDKRERKATGSYYTPDYIVKYIVEHTVGPVLEEKFEAMRPKLRGAQEKHREFLKRQETFRTQKMKAESDEKGDLIGLEVVDDLFDVKVLDPAMGSGHFLVEAVDFVSNRALDFLNKFRPWNPVVARLKRMRQTILEQMDEQGITVDNRRLTDVNLLKRHVLKRCIYGVDLNPMAVELSKVSLWLDCFTLGAPLSFLDHHMKCGNSLIGVTVQEVKEEVEADQHLLWGSQFAGLMLAADLMRHVGELSDLTTAQVEESRAEYHKAADALAPFKRMLDVYTSQWFGNLPRRVGSGRKKQVINDALDFLKGDACGTWAKNAAAVPSDKFDRRVVELTLADSEENAFFHWELEFPEVFYGPRRGTRQVVERLEEPGFDAVVGNPPYVRMEGFKSTKGYLRVHYAAHDERSDIYAYFLEGGLRLLNDAGRIGVIVSNKFIRSRYGASLRRTIARSSQVASLLDLAGLPVFPGATVRTVVLVATRKREDGEGVLFLATPDRTTFDVVAAGRLPLKKVVTEQAVRLPAKATSDENWTLQAPQEVAVLEKLSAVGVPLKQVVGGAVLRGVVPGLIEAFLIPEEVRQELVAECPKCEEIIKPCLRGRDIRRYRTQHAGLYLIYTFHGIDISKYKPVLDYLTPFREQLEGRATEQQWYELQQPQYNYLSVLEGPKIVTPDMATTCRFAFDEFGYFGTSTMHFIPGKNHYLLGVLNSQLAFFYLASACAALEGGGTRYLRFFGQYLEDMPIPAVEGTSAPNRTRCQQVARLVDGMLERHEQLQMAEGNEQAQRIEQKINEKDRQIDALVYRLYGLTEEEIAVVEGRLDSEEDH